jgi:lipoprotein-releasing system ATP-binding protein
MTATPLLELVDLRKTYEMHGRPLEVLRGVSLSLERGEMLALVGKSGSGKSTLMHIAGTLDAPSAGTVRFNGVDVFAQSEPMLAALRNGQIGFVFQSHHLLPEFSALENAALPLLIRDQSAGRGGARRGAGGLDGVLERLRAFLGRTGADERPGIGTRLALPAELRDRATEILESVGLGHRLHHLPTELSGGEQQRVAIARALVMRPRLLLADEPTGNLDDATGEEVLRVLLDLNEREGISAIVVTHSERLAARMPRRLRLAEGRLAEEPPPPALVP